MQVLWDLRKTLRCAALTGPTSDLKTIANEVICLFTAGRRGNQNTVLLLLNDEQIVDSLQDSIRSEIARHNITTFAPVAVLLIHVRKAEIEECEHVALKKELSDREKQEFEDKKKDLSRRYRDRHKHFHGFNVMQSNFSQAYVKEACAVLKPVKKTRKPQETQLATFLSLMNAYVPGSYLLESQCLAFLNDKDSIHEGLSLEDRMKPFGNLVITFPADMNSDRKVCMAHHMIAQQCTELLAEAGVTRSDTTRNFMSCLCNNEVSPCLLGFVKDMLTKRETLTEQEKEKFSRLILDIQKKEGNVQSASVLKVASRKFVKNPFFPQTLARFYYSEIKDYNQAEIWVYKAIDRDPKNSFIADTLGQVHKHHLNSKTWSKSPGNPREILQLATKAFEAFKNEERLAENAANTFNNRGMFGFLQVASTVYDALVKCNKDWKDVLTQTVSMGSVLKSLGDNKLYKFNDLISSLRDEVERKCKFFDIYLTYSKLSMKKDDRPYIWREVSSCYQKYVGNSPPKHLKHADNLPPGLKENKDGTLSLSQVYFILSQLTITQLTEISARTEEINSTEQATINYIAANITLQNMVQDLLSKCDRNMLIRKMPLSTNNAPECHMLALLMLWPQDSGEDSLFDLNTCIQVMHSSYENAYKKYLRSRYLRPLVFLGEGRGQSRIVHRSVLDEFFLEENKDATFEDLKKQWTNDGIFKNLRAQNRLLKLRGVVRNYRVYAACGDKEIEVNANLQDYLWKSGQVSFYLGFNIRGPVAFCIQRIDDKPTSEGKKIIQ
uniref:Uncharacterized protein n=1 Tax=Myripristis murdjan TaxID=586833 RepID=A0A667WQZ9_9TELE